VKLGFVSWSLALSVALGLAGSLRAAGVPLRRLERRRRPSRHLACPAACQPAPTIIQLLQGCVSLGHAHLDDARILAQVARW
jgi:hypothetical protein